MDETGTAFVTIGKFGDELGVILSHLNHPEGIQVT